MIGTAVQLPQYIRRFGSLHIPMSRIIPMVRLISLTVADFSLLNEVRFLLFFGTASMKPSVDR